MARRTGNTSLTLCLNTFGVLIAIGIGVAGLFIPVIRTIAIDVRNTTVCTDGKLFVTCIDYNQNGKCDATDLELSSTPICTTTTTTTIITTNSQQLPAARGLVAFWWHMMAHKRPNWASFNQETGQIASPAFRYDVGEERGGSQSLQYGKGKSNHSLSTIVTVNLAPFAQYLLDYNIDDEIFIRTNLTALPTGHLTIASVTYDKLYKHYVAVSRIASPFRHGLVIVNETTGDISEFTGTGGTAAPVDETPLDIACVDDKILLFTRQGSDMGTFYLFDRSTGQYTSTSTFTGTIVPHPKSYIPEFLSSASYWMYSASGYDPLTHTLYLVINAEGGFNRFFAKVNGTDDADVINQLESGNYNLYLHRYQPIHVINAAEFV